MVTMFRMINNMMIEDASKFLDPGSLFQGEPDESLVMLGKAIQVLKIHKECFFESRDQLPTFISRFNKQDAIMWTFRPKDIFGRFDKFMERLEVIQDIFVTANEFFKIEKIELGGLKGRSHSRGIQEVYNDFKIIYFKWTQITFDPLDPTPKKNHFDRKHRRFREESDILEMKIASILVQAFDECYTMESLIKLIEVCGTLLHRPIVYKEISDKLLNLLELYNEDLDKVKIAFDEGHEVIKTEGFENLKVDRGFPPVSGSLTWIKTLKTRILKPTEDLPNIDFKDIFESDDGNYTMDRMKEMCSLLDGLEVDIYGRWKKKVPIDINVNMQKFLLKSVDNGLLAMNFDPALVAALREVKLLKAMGKLEIPDVALELFEHSNNLWVSASQVNLCNFD